MKKVDVLMQALPYLRRWRGKTFLVKIGGALADVYFSHARLAAYVALAMAAISFLLGGPR